MARIALALVAENEARYVPSHARVLNSVRGLDRHLRVALASAGFRSFEIVREFDAAVTTSLAIQPPPDSGYERPPGARALLDVAYDSNVLEVLSPDMRVEIGSLTILMPGTNWEADGGGQILLVSVDEKTHARLVGTVASDAIAPSLLDAPSSREAASVATKMRETKRSLPLSIGSSDGATTRGMRKVLRNVSRVDGIALREGDIVKDDSGTPWYFMDGALVDTIDATIFARAMRIDTDGRTIRPRDPRARPPLNYIPDGARYQLTVAWPDTAGGGATVFLARSLGALVSDGGSLGPWGWIIDEMHTTLEHPKGVCQSEGGIFMDRATPELCLRDGGTWDRPCALDTECPFYDGRRGRGGCTPSGFCEMPLGVENMSYRSAGETGALMRIGCPPSDPTYPMCSASPDANAIFAHRDASPGGV